MIQRTTAAITISCVIRAHICADTSCDAFVPLVPSNTNIAAPTATTLTRRQSFRHQTSTSQCPLFMSTMPPSDNNENESKSESQPPEDQTNVDSMRSLLEASWNVGTMGAVPTSPQRAAEAASQSISSAIQQGGKKLLQVDIRLPAFDVTQGTNIYDEVLSVEFCTLLADNLAIGNECNKALILVKDGAAVRSAARILDAKERRRRDVRQEEMDRRVRERLQADRDDDGDEDEDEHEDYEDIAGTGSNDENDDDDEPVDTSLDVAAFRKSLIAGWDESDEEETASLSTESPAATSSKVESKTSDVEASASASARERRGREDVGPSVHFNPTVDNDDITASRSYRLGSWFADETISTGADMFTDAIEAVDTHGTMLNIEDVLIILSPVTREDTVAVRRLISRYKDNKTIVLVNNRLYPEPKELFLSEPVYSITPLIAKAMKSESNFMQQQSGDEQPKEDAPPTKIIVMRRYPEDWQIFVDVDGEGFDLVDSAPAKTVGKFGPDNEFIAGCVKNHMAFKFGQY